MRIFRISILFAAISLAGLGNVFAQTHDISSGGLPTLTGALSGSVSGSSSVLNDLVVTINFGEASPQNTNSIVKVTVPIAIRSTTVYQVTASITGTANANAQAIQKSDLGFGVNNFRSLGANAQVCNNSSHIFYSPFNNDPSTTATIAASGRVIYPSTLATIGSSTVLVSGPRLSKTKNVNRQSDNGYAFDAIIVLTPQFYADGSTSFTLTFTIGTGPNVAC